jgi:hypothetical protein
MPSDINDPNRVNNIEPIENDVLQITDKLEMT